MLNQCPEGSRGGRCLFLFFEIQNRGYTGKTGIHGDDISPDPKIRNCLLPYAHIEHLRIFRTVRIHHVLFVIGQILPCPPCHVCTTGVRGFTGRLNLRKSSRSRRC